MAVSDGLNKALEKASQGISNAEYWGSCTRGIGWLSEAERSKAVPQNEFQEMPSL